MVVHWDVHHFAQSCVTQSGSRHHSDRALPACTGFWAGRAAPASLKGLQAGQQRDVASKQREVKGEAGQLGEGHLGCSRGQTWRQGQRQG